MDAYYELLHRYVQDLRRARHEALAWWEELLAREVSAVGDHVLAKLNIELRWPCGPVSYPRVIAVFRQYYLECQTLDVPDGDVRGDPDDEALWGSDDEGETSQTTWPEPRQLLIEHLANVDEELGEFMSSFVLIPLGIDADERAV